MRCERVKRPTRIGAKRAEELLEEDISLGLSRSRRSQVFQGTMSEAGVIESAISNFCLLYSPNCRDW